ncbi:MAG: TAXI family TRAP transporter solute-binding subunit [Acidimicrobiales bacterium]
MVLALSLALAAPAAAQSLAERANRGLVEVITGSVSGTSAKIAEDLADLLDDGATRRVLPVVGKGSLQNITDLKALRGIDLAIIQTDVLDYARTQKISPGIESSITYIAKLYNEEFHLLARGDIKSVADLAGKKVNFGIQGDGTTVTGSRVFDLLKIKVVAANYDQTLALDRLKSGEIAAMAYVAAKPAPLFTSMQPQDGLHFLPIPLKPEIVAAYIPVRLTAEDYPRLVSAQAPVDTVAVGSVLLVANLLPESERYRNVVNFVDAFFTQFPKLLEAPHHPKWSEVNLAAELPNWRRFPPADSWLKRNAAAPVAIGDQQLRDIFAKFLDERTRIGGGQAMSSQEKEDLFSQFKRWQTGHVQ